MMAALVSARRVRGYVDRLDFVAERCRGRRVLDLGVVGATCDEPGARVRAFPSSLHLRIVAVAASVVGVDHSRREIEALGAEHPGLRLYCADVEELGAALAEEEPFDVVVAGDLLEHLSNPGHALDEIRPLLRANGELIVTCPNAFGAPNLVRFTLGRYREGPDHVQSYNKHTLAQLLERHGFAGARLWTAIDHWPASGARRALYRVGAPLLGLFPELGGTLVAVASVAQPSEARQGAGREQAGGVLVGGS
jgi:SAM-dependent methyltransferase